MRKLITATGDPPPHTPGIKVPRSPLIRFLDDPDAFFAATWNNITSFTTTWWPVLTPTAVATLGLVLGTRHALRVRHRRNMADGSRLIEVEVPQNVHEAAAQVFWARLHALLRPGWRRFLDGQPHLVFEYSWNAGRVRLGIWVPGPVPPGMVESAIAGVWPGARTVVHRPAASPIPNGPGTAGRLRLAKSEALPLNAKHDLDPLNTLFSAAAQLNPGEHAAVQVLLRPATGRRTRLLRRRINRLRCEAAGHHRTTARTLSGSALDELAPNPAKGPSPLGGRTDPVASADLRAAVVKHTGPLWETEIRYVVAIERSPRTPAERADLHARARGLAHALASSFGVHTGRNWWARKRLWRSRPALEGRWFRSGDLLSVGELAALAHLPLDPTVFGVTRAGARCVAPPPQIPTADRLGAVKVLGDADAGPVRPVGLAVPDARQHTHILGATGSGKSTLMGRMILDDVAAGRGVVVIDPKGDLITDLLQRLPTDTSDRTVLIDPTIESGRPSLNILTAGDTELTVDNLVGIFRRIFADSWGPRTDDVLRSSCLTLLAARRAGEAPPTLADVPDLLADEVLRERIVAALPDDGTHRTRALRTFWNGYRALTPSAAANVTAPLLNKLRAFLLRDFVADVIAKPASTIDLRKVLDGGILLVRLPKGVLGDETARLLGSLIVASTWHAASARAKSAEGVRIDASLFVDECHNFLNMPVPLEDMLAEARAYRLSLVLAHQNLAQMPTDLREGISANTRNKVFFTCSPEDAKALSRHVAPMLAEHDLVNLSGYQAAVRLCVGGVTAPAFTMRTRPLPTMSRPSSETGSQSRSTQPAPVPLTPPSTRRATPTRAAGHGSLQPSGPRRVPVQPHTPQLTTERNG